MNPGKGTLEGSEMSKRGIGLLDLLPPILVRVLNRLRKKPNSSGPFDRIPQQLRPKWILDIGANHGDISRLALQLYQDCRVICFEPVTSTFETLKANLKEYGDRVVYFKKALSDSTGSLEINLTSSDGANSFDRQAPFHKKFNPYIVEVGKETVETVRLDEVCQSFPTLQVDVMKIDVEGHELRVLAGGKDFICNWVDTILIEMSLQRDITWEHQSFLAIINLLYDFGFRLINIYDVYSRTNKETDSNMMLTQFDCVFRHKRYLSI